MTDLMAFVARQAADPLPHLVAALLACMPDRPGYLSLHEAVLTACDYLNRMECQARLRRIGRPGGAEFGLFQPVRIDLPLPDSFDRTGRVQGMLPDHSLAVVRSGYTRTGINMPLAHYPLDLAVPTDALSSVLTRVLWR